MLPRKYLYLFILLISIIVIVIILFSLLSNQLDNLKTDIGSEKVRQVPEDFASGIENNFKILYQDPQDKEGRTIVYTSDNKYIYNDSGMISFPGSRTYYIGLFDGWKSIPGSLDRELILLDPFNKISLGSFRVVFEENPVFNTKTKTTRVSVENIDKARKVVADEGTEEYDTWVPSITSFNQSQLDTLIYKGDALIAYPLQYSENKKLETKDDGEGRMYIQMILLRRTNGAEDIK